MTTTAQPPTPRSMGGQVQVLGPGDEQLLTRLTDRDRARHCFAAARLSRGGLDPMALGGQAWGYGPSGRVDSALLVGANIVPVETDAPARRAFAEHALACGRRSSSIVGPADEVLDLWDRLAGEWGPARDVRSDQPLMVASAPPTVHPDPAVRRTTLDDLDALFPACVAMFTEEVGVSPIAGGAGPGYRRRVADLIRRGRSLARFENGTPVFKAELGAVSPHAVQIQGVWVHPDWRGRGLAAAGMARVVEFARESAPVVSLYVNAYNTAALAAYRRAGFRQRERFATILF